jgi:MerR family transcriptional regulator/heat shock protein HspR
VASEQIGAAQSGRTAVSSFGPDDDTPVFVISVAAQLAGMHAQTLRQYDRLGLVSPSRTRGGGRRYSGRDVALLREVQRLSQEEGVSLAGIQRILELENQVTALRTRITELGAELHRQTRRADARAQLESRIFAAGAGGEIVAVRPGQRPPRFPSASQALVLWQPHLGERHSRR